MEHLVRFTTAEGREGHHYADSLEETLKFVERLRNAEDAQDVRVFRLREVQIEFRAYYKVELRAPEVTDVEDPPVAVPPVSAITEDASDAARPLVASAVSEGDPNGDHGARRLFQRG